MLESDSAIRKQELIRSINWWVWASCVSAGLIGGGILMWLRLTDQLPVGEYTYTRIALHSFGVGLVMPICLSIAFRLTAMPEMKPWLECLGAFMLFLMLPMVVAFGILQWVLQG